MRGDFDKIPGEIRSLVKRLEAFYSPQEAYVWLAMPHPQLEGYTPVQMIQEGSTKKVESIIDRLEGGVYL